MKTMPIPPHGFNCRECHHQKRKFEENAFIVSIPILNEPKVEN